MTLGEFSGLHKNASDFLGIPFIGAIVLAFAGQPSLHGYCHVVSWIQGAFWRNCRQILCMTSFSRFRVFMCSRNSSFWWRGAPVWHLWIGRARHPGPDTASFAVEVFNVGGWLKHARCSLSRSWRSSWWKCLSLSPPSTTGSAGRRPTGPQAFTWLGGF